MLKWGAIKKGSFSAPPLADPKKLEDEANHLRAGLF